MPQKTDKIYDRIFKRMLTLSSGLVIGLINSLFNIDYAIDSKVIYNLTENVDSQLRRTLADVIITVQNQQSSHSYHMEAQMYEDENIIFRMFDYGYQHAVRTSSQEKSRLIFPEPVVIYLADGNMQSDTYILTIDFGQQGLFDYSVPVCNFITLTLAEIEQKNLVILLPFYILKLRQTMKRDRSQQILDQLKKLIFDDILGIIQRQLTAGLLTINDAAVLRELLVRLYNHLYADYEECEKGGLNTMIEDELVLQVDIVAEEVTKKVTKKYQEKLDEKDRIIHAYKLRLKNVPEEQIAAETGLSIEEIHAL